MASTSANTSPAAENPTSDSPPRGRLLGAGFAWAVGTLLVLAPPALIARLIHRYGVDLPLWDGWAVGLRFEQLLQGHWLQALWQPHLQHRIPLPMALFFLLVRWSGWDVRYELWSSFAVVLVTWAAFAWLARPSVAGPSRSGWTLALWALASLVLFSPTQRANWMWGWQLQTFLNVCAASWCLVVLSRVRSTSRLLVAVLLGLAATFSFANGLVLWPLGLLVLLCRRADWRLVGPWAIASVATVGIYLVHFPGNRTRSLGLTGVPSFFFRYVGLPVGGTAWNGHLSLWLGALGAALAAVAATGFLVRLRRQGWTSLAARELAWLSLATYGFGCALLSGLGRAVHAGDRPLHLRYATFANLVWLGLAGFLVLRLAEHRSGASRARWQEVLSAALSLGLLVVGSLVAADATSRFSGSWHSDALRRGQLVRGFLTPGETRVAFPNSERLHHLLRFACAQRLTVFRHIPRAEEVDCSVDSQPPPSGLWGLSADARWLVTSRGYRIPLDGSVRGELHVFPGLHGRRCVGGWLWDERVNETVEDVVVLSSGIAVRRSLARPDRRAVARAFSDPRLLGSGIRVCFEPLTGSERLFAISRLGHAVDLEPLLR